MKYYYKDTDYQRYKQIREEKLKINERRARIKFFSYAFSIAIIFYFLIPSIQVYFFYGVVDKEFDEYFWKIISTIYISFTYTVFISFVIIKFYIRRFTENDIEMKMDILRPLVVRVTILSIACVSIPFLVWYIIIGNNQNFFPNGVFYHNLDLEAEYKYISKFFVIFLLLYNLSLLLFLNIFIYLPERLKIRIKNEENKKFQYTYWAYFLKSTILNYPQFLVGLIVFVFLTLLPGFLQKEWHHYGENFLGLLSSYFSIWFVGFTMSALPVIQGLIEYGESFYKYSVHIIRDIILPNLKDHTIIVGTGNLGGLLIKSCFFDIHYEGYGVKTICFPENKLNEKKHDDYRDYCLVIDHNLDIFLVSRRLLVIDKNASHFKYVFGNNSKFLIGLLPPGSADPKSEGIMVIGICGDAKDYYVLNGARINNSKIIINANPDATLSYDLAKLAKREKPEKQVLSITSTPSFDVLNIYTYDNQIYLVDTKHIEGISISQRIILWVIKYLKDRQKRGLEYYRKEEEDRVYKQNKFLFNIPKILIIGNGRAISQTIQSLIFSLYQIFGTHKSIFFTETIHRILREKLFIMTNDEFIISETHKEYLDYCAHNIIYKNWEWKFYPVKFSEMKIESNSKDNLKSKQIISDLFSVPVYLLDPNNAENYFTVLNAEKPDLIVLNSESKYDSISMLNRSSNATKIIENNNNGGKYRPNIIVYSHKDDKNYILDQMKKHFTSNLERDEVVGFPSQQDKESKLTRDYVTANQFSSMIRSLLDPDKEAELTFTVNESPGELARTLMKLSNMDIARIHIKTEVPSFIFCYSFADRRYKDTFIFTGTAELKWLEDGSNCSKNTEADYNFCFINCNEKDREDLYNTIKKNLNGESIIDSNELNEPGTLRDCPISSIYRHSEKHFDTIYRSSTSRFLKFKMKDDSVLLNNIGNLKKGKESFLKGVSDLAHYKIWGEGLYPGALAETLLLAILGSVDKRRYFDKDIEFIPNINFGTSYPYPGILKRKINKVAKGQESLYIRLWDEKKFRNDYKNSNTSDEFNRNVQNRYNCFDNGVVRAIIIKKGGEFEISSSGYLIDNDSGWLKYSIELVQHLNNEYSKSAEQLYGTSKYSIFVIEKNFVEGLWLQKFNPMICKNEKTELIEINNYYKINHATRNCLIDFQVIKKEKENTSTEGHSRDRYDYTRDFRFGENMYQFPGPIRFDFKSQIYKLAIIRNDIVDNAKSNFHNEFLGDCNINKMFFIDDL